MNPAPEIWIIAGPNGSGKTTLTSHLVPKGIPVINPDEIARKIAGDNEKLQAVALKAAREALRQRRELIAKQKSFALETTLSGEGIKNLVADAKQAGYKVNLLYVSVEKSSLSVRRVQQRVKMGGHDVPEREITRRFERSHQNLPKVIAQSDKGVVIDNSGQKPVLVAEISKGKLVEKSPCKWLQAAMKPEKKRLKRKIIDLEARYEKQEAEKTKEKEQKKDKQKEQDQGLQLERSRDDKPGGTHSGDDDPFKQ